MEFNRYPYTDFHELNLDWVISQVQEFNRKLDEFIAINTIKFADPIGWNVSEAYESNTVVVYEYNSYISKKPVPAGVDISNTDYWLKIADFDKALEDVIADIRSLQEHMIQAESDINTNTQDIIEINQHLVTTDSDINTIKYEKANNRVVAPYFNILESYVAGQYVIDNGNLYKCIQNCQGVSTSDTNYWNNKTISSELTELNNNIVTLSNSFSETLKLIDGNNFNTLDKMLPWGKWQACYTVGNPIMPTTESYIVYSYDGHGVAICVNNTNFGIYKGYQSYGWSKVV